MERSPLQVALLRRLRAATSGEFEIVRDLGHGSMARVYLAYEVALDRHVALKVLSPLFGEYPEIIRRFQREARTAAQLNHPHIVPVFNVYQGNGLCFFTMPFVEGSNLRQILDETNRIAVPTAIEYLGQAASALAYAHEHGVVHRDVKPENMLLDGSTGRLVLSDFGLARALGTESATIPGDLIGTPHYMAPEQCEEQVSVDARSDQYSLALVAYEMFAGAYPFSGLGLRELLVKRLSADPPPLRSVRPDVPSHVSAAIQRALSRDPEERFPSMEAFMRSVRGDRSGVMVSERLGSISALVASLSARLSAASLPAPRRPRHERVAARTAGGWKVWAARVGVIAIAALTCYLAIAAMSGTGDAHEVEAAVSTAAKPGNPLPFIGVADAEDLAERPGPGLSTKQTNLAAGSMLEAASAGPDRAAEAAGQPTVSRPAARDAARSNVAPPGAGGERTLSTRGAATPAPQALLESYRRSLELEDLEGLRALYIGPMPPSEEVFLSKMFERGEGIQAQMKLVDLESEGRRATADVDFRLTYVRTRTKWSRQHTLKLRLDLVGEPGGWLILDSKRR